MHRASEALAGALVARLDQQVWTSLAERAVSKMPKFKLANETQKMLHDFTILNSDQHTGSPGELPEQKEQTQTFKENMIIGTSKLTSLRAADMPQPIVPGKDRKRLASAVELNQGKKCEPTKAHLFRLTTCELGSPEQQKVDETLRTAKYDNIRYNQSLEASENERRTASEHRSLVEKKKFKDMKVFTYDYEGKLISLANEKTKNGGIHVVNMKPHFGTNLKTTRVPSQKPSKQQNILEIVNKKIVGSRTPVTEFAKEADKEKEEKLARLIKSGHPTSNMLEYFKEEDKVSMGVTITDMNSKSRFTGRRRDQSEIKNTKFNNFKGEFKQLENFQDKLMLRRLKLKEQQHSAFRTEYHESSNMRRLHTEGTMKQSKVFTSATAYSKKRGVIAIENQKLYSQNFIEDLD